MKFVNFKVNKNENENLEIKLIIKNINHKLRIV